MTNPFETESYLSFLDKQPKYKIGLGNVCVAKTFIEDGYEVIDTIYGHNIITNEGVDFYAKQMAPTLSLGSTLNFYSGTRMELRTGAATPAADDTYTDVTTPITASRKTTSTPALNNTDTLNTSNAAADRDVTITYKVEYSTSDFSSSNSIIGGCIHNVSAPASSTKLLSHWTFETGFTKASTDSLTVWLNHKLGRA